MKDQTKQDGLYWQNDQEQPQAVYQGQPTIDTSKLCRGCNNGAGDNICGYHANWFRRQIQRQERIYRIR